MSNFIRKITALLLIIILTLEVFYISDSLSVSAASSKKSKTSSSDEMKGVWFAFYSYDYEKCKTAEAFRSFIGEAFDNIVAAGCNAVFIHVHSHGDSIYPSKYYPWSKNISGTQGKNPGYDALQIIVEEGHSRGLQIHAWLNPYRVTESGTDPLKLSEDNPARIYLTNSKTSDDRYVLAYNNKLYYNPSIPAVRKRIVKAIKEIVKNYDVDGIHFDDYFYPAFGEKNYDEVFDAPEYKKYVKKCKKQGAEAMTIVEWRKENCNILIRSAYAAVKEIDPDCVFGISPGGFIDYFDDVNRWYVDYRTWVTEDGYIDYICPQLYWSFNTLNIYPFVEVMNKWQNSIQNSKVKFYIGVPVYKMNTNTSLSTLNKMYDSEWYNQYTLANMVRAGRESGRCDGFVFFDYKYLVAERNKTAVQYLVEELNK